MISPEQEKRRDTVLKLPKNDLPVLTEAWPIAECDTHKIPISSHQKYFEALFMDNAQVVRDTIKAQKDPSLLLNCEFDFQYCATNKSRKIKRVSLPFHIAVGNGSLKVAEVLLELGTEGESTDSHGRNVLHNLVTMVAYMNGIREEVACATVPWLIEKFGTDLVYKLSRQENKEGLRPLEYAAQQNTLKLTQTLLETRGLYVTSGITKGDTHFLELDVTEYETVERHAKSPLTALAYLDHKKMEDPDSAKVVLSPVFASWISAKKKTDAIPLIMWILYRLLIFIIFIISDVNVEPLHEIFGENSSFYLCDDLSYVHIGSPGETVLLTIVLVGMVISFTLLLVVFIRDRKLGLCVFRHNLRGKKTLVSNTSFFVASELAYFITVLIAIVTFYDTQSNGPSDTRILILNITRLILPLVFVWLLIYFLQLVPLLGPFIISVQGMIGDLVRFILLFVLIIFPFAHAFETFLLTNSKEGCIDAFSNPVMTCYTLFRMMLNMYDLSQHDITHIGALYVMHVIFVFVVAVLLLNFLIAIMSSSASQIADHEKLLLTIHQVAILNELERYSFWARRWVYPSLNKLGFAVCQKRVILRFETCRLRELADKGQGKHTQKDNVV